MAFAQQPINYAAQYSNELALAYPYLSYFSAIWNAGESSRFRPLQGKTVMIPAMTTSGAVAVNRDQITGVFSRNFNVEWDAKTLSMDREWSTIIDPMDIVETSEVATIANVTRVFNEQQKIPEQDAYMASKLAGYAAEYGGTDSTSLSSANILATWDSYLEYMTNQRVNRDRLVCYITPAAYKLLKEAAGITRFVSSDSGIRNVDRNVGKLDGVTIVEVPGDMMKSAYNFTSGWEIGSSAVQINMILADPSALVAPIVYDTSMIGAPTAQSAGKYIYYERYYYDVFNIRPRQAGIFVNIASAPTIGSLTVVSKAGTASGATSISYTGDNIGQGGAPAEGLEAYITSGNTAAPSVTYGSALPTAGGVTWTKCTGQNPVKLTSQTAGKYATVALVNKQTGYAVAVGSDTEKVGA